MEPTPRPLANLSRRGFLIGGSVIGAGLVLGYRHLRGPEAPVGAPAGSPVAASPKDAIGTEVGPWVRVAPDGRVTVWVEKAEMGQGIHSTLAALVAEELEVPWEQVRIEARSFHGPVRAGMFTGASITIQESWTPLRIAGAAARTMLVSAAAAAWSVPAAECVAAAGRVEHRATGRSFGYGELAERAAALPVPEAVELKSPETFQLLGKSLPRLDLPEKVYGSARYGIDAQVDGLLHAAPALSPVPGGRVASASYDAARAQPGVRGIVEIPGGVAVVADHYWQARRALEVLAPTFTGGEPVVDTPAYAARLLEALNTPGLPAGETGAVDSALASAERTIEARYEVPYLAHATMEPMNCTASVSDDGCALWATTQGPSQLRIDVGAALGIDPERVSVTSMLMGGGFGRRIHNDVAVQAALISQAVSRPVKLIWSREDDIRHDFYRPACAAHLRAGVDASGQPVAFVSHVAGPWSDPALPSWLRGALGQAQKRIGSPLAPEGSLPNVLWWRLPYLMRSGVDWIASGNSPPLNYAVPNQRLEYSMVENPLPVGWWRSVQASQNAFFLESFVDELAHAAAADPFEYRRGLLTGRDRAVLERAAEMARWGRALPEGRAFGIAQYAMAGTSVAEVAEVGLGAGGVPRVYRVFCAIDCGRVLNPDTVRAQVEGSILFGLSAALYGRITVKSGSVEQSNFHDYRALRFGEIPEIETQTIESREEPSGVGEPATPPIAPAVANALFALTRKRIRTLPLVSASE